MKTILHVIDTTGPGGAETVFVTLASAVAQSGCRSIALIRGPGWVQDALQKANIQAYILECKGSFNIKFLLQLVALIRREKVDVVQSHLLGSNVYCALAGFLARVPVIASFHGGVDVAANERFMRAKFGAINLFSRAVVAVSYTLAKDLEQRARLDPKKIQVIYNGIDTAQFGRVGGAAKTRFALPAGAFVFGALGNIRPAKAYEVLLDAFARVIRKKPEAHLIIGGQGSGKLYDSLLEQRTRLGLSEHVHFVGFVDSPAEYLSELDAFVLSSRSEGFSIATVQAMASGLPVVSTRSGGPEEIIKSGETGLLVANENPAALEEAMLCLMDDPALCKRLAAAGKASAAERFDVQAMLRAYLQLY